MSSLPSLPSSCGKVVIIGSGPVGLAVASLLKIQNKELDIKVFDKRPDTTRRHGLKIDSDTVDKMMVILDSQLLVTTNEKDIKSINDLKKVFSQWRGKVIRTKDIEDTLAEKASSLGVSVLRGEEYTIKSSESNRAERRLDTGDETLKQAIDEAEIIIGADGSHSVVREIVMENKLEQEKNLNYLIEFKYQTKSTTKRRNLWNAVKLSLKTGSIDFETMGRGSASGEAVKPATLHITVNKSTYDKFRPTDEDGNPTKGIFQHPWTREEIQELAKKEPEVAKVLKVMNKYAKDVEKRGGQCTDIKITTIPLNVYRSQHVSEKYGDKYVLLAGDASSGVVFGRGVNKGFQESVLCAQAVDEFFKEKIGHQNTDERQLPKPFKEYDRSQRKLFMREKMNATRKAQAAKIAKMAILPFAEIYKKVT